MRPLQQRFWERVEMIPFHSCWEWIGSRKTNGYGRIYVGGPKYLFKPAHRVAMELSGVLVGSACVLHHCDNPSCVRPAHLFLGTVGDNNTDRNRKGRSAKRACSRHDQIEANAYLNPRGHRECRACRREAVQRYKERNR